MDWVVYIALFVGLFVRAVWPYLIKYFSGETEFFDIKYLRSSAASVVIFLITTPFTLPTLPTDINVVQKFFIVAVFAYGLNSFLAHTGLNKIGGDKK